MSVDNINSVAFACCKLYFFHFYLEKVASVDVNVE